MSGWLWSSWLQIWPNLAANVLWVPFAWMHHRVMRHRMAQYAEQLHRQAEQHHEELKAHVESAVKVGLEKGA